MTRRILVTSPQEDIGKSSIALGAACVLALRGEKSGYLVIAYVHGLGCEVDGEDWKPVEADESSRVSRYDLAEPGFAAELIAAELVLPTDALGPVLAELVCSKLGGILRHADYWICEWRLPSEFITEPIEKCFDEIWCLRDARDPARLARCAWIDVPVIIEASGSGTDRGIVREGSTRSFVNGVPFVFAEPAAGNSLSVAELVMERLGG